MTAESPATAGRLHREALAAIDAVRGALRALLAVLPPTENAADLSRALGIDYATSWKLTRLAGPEPSIAVGVDVPRPGSLKRVIRVCTGRGVPAEILDHLRSAIEHFEDLATRHGGERATFDAMLATLDAAMASRLHLASKRDAYRANSRLFGIQSDAFIICVIAPPVPADAATIRRVGLIGHRGLKRFDPRARLSAFSTGADGSWGRTPTIPLAWRAPPASEAPSRGLIPEFSSVPPSAIGAVYDEVSSRCHFVLTGDTVGLTSAVDVMTASTYDIDIKSAPIDPRRNTICSAGIDFPSGTLLLDLFVHNSILANRVPRCEVSAAAGNPLHSALARPDLCSWLPAQEKAEILGRGPDVARCREFPNYPDLLRHAFQNEGLEGLADYTLVRCKVLYPIVGTHIVLRLQEEASS